MGKFIVFEGTDGSGKKTQAELLLAHLKKSNTPHAYFDFPRYQESFFGNLAGELLSGKLGEKIPSKLAVLPFACDRWLVKENIKKSMSEMKLVLSNRYSASSAVYHAAKLPVSEQEDFMHWVFQLEYEIIGLPKEDLVLYFHMPVDYARSLIEKRGNGKDTYEKDVELLKTVERLYLSLSRKFSHWKTIECMKNNEIKKPEEIHREVLDILAL